LKASILTVAFTHLLFLFAPKTYAACNTVMGGCTTEEVVNVAPHMRSDGTNHQKKPTAKTVDKPSKQTNNMVAASKSAPKKL